MKRNLALRAAALCALLIVAATIVSAQGQPRLLLSAVTGTGAGSGVLLCGSFNPSCDPHKTYLASVSGTGSVSTTVNVEVTNNPAIGWVVLATISLSGTTSASNGTNSAAAWPYVRGNVTAVSGTGAAVTLSIYP
jgi:hypothetical protein